MKNFFQFLSESTAVQQAKRMGLVGDGHGGWYDKKGEFVAKTEKGQLKFYNKRQRVGKQDPPNTDTEKRLSQATSSSEIQEPQGPPEVEKTKLVIQQKIVDFFKQKIGTYAELLKKTNSYSSWHQGTQKTTSKLSL